MAFGPCDANKPEVASFPAGSAPVEMLGDDFMRKNGDGVMSNALARAVFFHRLGEMRDRTFENQNYRASGLNLIVAAIILWNTVYLDRTLQELANRGSRSIRPKSSISRLRAGSTST